MAAIQSLAMMRMVLGIPKTMGDAGAFEIVEEQPIEESTEEEEEDSDDPIGRMAMEIFSQADRQTVNGKVTLTELQANLLNTKHHKFQRWMTRNRAANFKRFDADRSYTLSLKEIKEAVRLFLSPEGQGMQEPPENGISREWFKYHVDQAAAMDAVTISNAASIAETFSSMMGIDMATMVQLMEHKAPPEEEAPRLLPPPRPRKRITRRRYAEPTIAYKRRVCPAITTCFSQLGSSSAMGLASWWDKKFPEPVIPPLPGMPHQLGNVNVSSPWLHPPSRLEGEHLRPILLESPARCATPHSIRHHRAPRARGTRFVLEGVIKLRSRSMMDHPEEMSKRLQLPPLPRGAVWNYNQRVRQMGFATFSHPSFC